MHHFRILHPLVILFLIILVTGCTTGAGTGTKSTTPADLPDQTAHSDQSVQTALSANQQQYATSVEGDTGDHAALAGRAAIFAAQGNTDAALEHFNLAIWLAPEIAAYYAGRAAVYEDTGKLEAAINDYEEAISLTADDLPYLARKARIAFALQDYATADTDAARVLAFSQNLPEQETIRLLTIRAESLMHAGKANEVGKDYCAVAETLCKLGECSYRQNCK